MWAVLDAPDLKTAISALSTREATSDRNIGVWRAGETAPTLIPQLAVWAHKRHLNAVIWTNLHCKFGSQKFPADAGQVIAHLRGLEGEQLKKAAEYVRRAPRQIDTALRRAIATALGWECDGD
jgi:hypothetical protein